MTTFSPDSYSIGKDVTPSAALASRFFAAVRVIFLALLFVASVDVSAQITRPFTIRYSTNDNGDIKLIGNTVMTCAAGFPGTPLSGNCLLASQGTANGTGVNNNDWAMRNINVDTSGLTFNSTQATLSMPSGSTVKFAGVYWSGTSTSAQRGTALFKTPTSFGFSTLTATSIDTASGQANNYSGFADVTALVTTGGNGLYTVANIQTQDNTAGVWGGWVLVVVYQNLTDTLKNLVVYDGYGLVTNTNPVTITPSGFLTPLSGPVTTRVGAAGFDGDLGFTGDGFSVNGTPMTDSLNVTTNFFNSVISENGVQLPGRNPSFVNNLGVDVDRVNVPTGVVPNGATSATLQLTAPSENYHPVLITFATDLYVPIIAQNVVKTLTDLNGPPLLPGDTLRWTVSMSNTGQDTGTNLIVKDPIPANTTFVPGSLVVASGANTGTKTDASGDDQAEYSVSAAACTPVAAPCVIFRLGSAANSASGGNLAFGQSTSFTFDTTVNSGLPAGTSISNSASVSYSGQTLPATFTTSSAAASASTVAAPVISKSFSPGVIATNGTSTLTIVLSSSASNPTSLTGVAFTDTYPAGVVNSATPNANVVCTGGSTPGTITGGVAAGNTIGMSPGATLAPGGSCTITLQVTSAAAGVYVNTTSAVTSSNAGTGNTASDTLFVGKVAITKAFSVTPFEVGQNSTITFTLTNFTGAAASGIAFTDTYPGGIQNTGINGGTCVGTTSAAATTTAVSFSAGTLASGASCTLTVQVTGIAPGGVFTNITSGVTRTGDAVAGDPATAGYTVVAAPTIAKTFSPTSINLNENSQVSITIANPNTTTTVTRAGAVFLDTYPAGLVNTTPASVTINCTAGSTAAVTAATGAAGGSTIGLSTMTLAPGGTCTVTSMVTATTAGNKVNPNFTATFDNAPDPTGGTATLTVVALLEPTVTKTFVTNPIAQGGTSVLRIVLTNPNATGAGNTITGIAFTDSYPAGLVNAAVPSPTIAGGSCSGGTLTAAAGGNSISLSGAQITATAGTDTCTIDVTVTAAAAGAYLNSTGNITTGNTLSQTTPATAILNVLGPPTITKSFSPAVVAAGGTATLSIVISNPVTNPVSLAGVSFSDVFPTTPGAMTLANPLTTTNTCTSGGTTGTLQDSGGGGLGVGDVGIRINPGAGATIPSGGSCTVTANVTVPTVGDYVNTTSTVTSTNGGTGTTASATLTVGRLGIVKSFSPTTIAFGGTSTITFSISNSTGAAVTGLTFSDILPSGMSLSSATVGGTCTAVASNAGVGVTTLNVTSGNVPIAGCTVTVTVTSTATGNNNNQSTGVSALGVAVGPASNVATLVVQSPPTVAKNFSPTVIGQAGTSLLTISLSNNNAVDATSVSITDTYPSGVVNAAVPGAGTTCVGGTLTAVAAAGTITYAGGTIPANSTCIITVNVTVATAGSYANSIAAGSLSASSGLNTVAANATLTVLLPPTAAKAFSPGAIAINGTSVLSITLTNPNATAISGVAFTDTYPNNLRNATVPNLSSTCGGSVTATPNATNPGVLTLSGGTIPANGTCTVSVNVTSTASANYTNSTGSITTTNAGTGSAASDVLSVGLPNIDKVFSPNPVQLGLSSTLTFTLTNGTPSNMTSVAFSDTFPTTPAAMVVATPSTTTNTCGGTFTATAGAGSVSLTGATIPANGTCTLSVAISVPVAASSIGTYNNTTGAISAAGPLTGNTASASLTVSQAVPVVNKAFSGALTVGGTQTVTFTVTQPNGNPTQTFSFTDTLPAGFVVASPSTVGGTCSGGSVTAVAASSAITVTGRQIVNPATTCTITILVTTAASPTVGTCPQASNTNGNANIGTTTNATASVANSAAGGGTSTSGACVTVIAAVPTINKTFAGGLTVGGAQTLTFTVNQPAGNTTQTFSFTDTLPAGLVLAATPGVVNGCTGGTITAAGGATTISAAGVQIANPAASCTISMSVTTSASPTVGTCPQASNTNGSVNIGATTNINANVGNSAAGGGSSTTGACVTVSAATPSLNKSFGGALPIGTTQTMTFVVSQPSGNPSQTISFTDTLPSGLVLATTPGVANGCTGGTITATAGSNVFTAASVQIANPATSCSITVNVTTSGSPAVSNCPTAANTNGNAQIGGLTNLVSAITDAAFGGGTAGAVGTGACIAVTPAADLFIAKTNGAAGVNAGLTTNSYTVTVTNNGPSSVTGAILTDGSVAGLSKTAVICSGTPGQCVSAPTIAQLEGGAFTLPALASGQTYELTVTTKSPRHRAVSPMLPAFRLQRARSIAVPVAQPAVASPAASMPARIPVLAPTPTPSTRLPISPSPRATGWRV